MGAPIFSNGMVVVLTSTPPVVVVASASASTPSSSIPVRFTPFRSTPDPSFWLVVNSSKLNVLRLNEDGARICGHYGPSPPMPYERGGRSTASGGGGVGMAYAQPAMRFDPSSYRDPRTASPPPSSSSSSATEETTSELRSARRNELIRSSGGLRSFNTLESLRRLNKNDYLNETCLPDMLRCCGVDVVVPPLFGGGERKEEDGGGKSRRGTMMMERAARGGERENG